MYGSPDNLRCIRLDKQTEVTTKETTIIPHAFDKKDIVIFENKVKALTFYFVTET